MTIALVAHDSKKELMVQFCTAYRHILAQHHLIATGTTGRLVEENVGLPVQKFLPGGHGGGQQVMARIACEEVDMLLFFRDPIAAKPSEPNEMNLLRICDVHNIPVATNIARTVFAVKDVEIQTIQAKIKDDNDEAVATHTFTRYYKKVDEDKDDTKEDTTP